MASNLNFKTWNSLNFFNTYFNKYVVLNDDFEKTISKTFGEQIQKSLKPYEIPEGEKPENLPDDIPEALLKDFKYVAIVNLTDFNYTFTATMTGFDVAENDNKGLEVLINNPGYGATNIESISIAINGTGDTYGIPLTRFCNDSVLVIAQYPAQFDLALSTKSAGTWTKNLYGTIKNTIVVGRQLVQALQKLQNAFYYPEAYAEEGEDISYLMR